jgi:CubicO group peptidase (beta-lactamase class C family)
LCAHVLARRGELDLDAAVGRYWSAFHRGTNRAITVATLLNHQAGLPGTSRPLALDDFADFEAMARAMEREPVLWRPGTRHGYHAMTFGWLVGEVVRRVAGRSLGSFFRSEIADPYGIDLSIGLDATAESRTARTLMQDLGVHALGPRFAAAVAIRKCPQVARANSIRALLVPGACDKREVSTAEIPAVNGVTNARGLARMYATIASLETGVLDGDQLSRMGATESAGGDAVMLEPSRFSSGFGKAGLGRTGLNGSGGLILSEPAFGHSGLGGSVGFVDPVAQIVFGYVTNRDPGVGRTRATEAKS